MQLYIVRHGQSENNALMQDQVHRVKDPALTDIGKIQAERVGDYLANTLNIDAMVLLATDDPGRNQVGNFQFSHLYCSAMHRALQTAQPIGKALGMKPEVWPDIHEHGGIYLKHGGMIQGYGGMTRSQIEAEFPGYVLPDTITEDGWWNPDDGFESNELCMARALRVGADLRKWGKNEEHAEDVVILVSHGTFIDRLIKAIMNSLPGIHHRFWHYNTAITRIDLGMDEFAMIRYMNRTDHLTPELMTI